MTGGHPIQAEPPARRPLAAWRLALPLVVWLGGATLLIFYPPMQLVVRTTGTKAVVPYDSVTIVDWEGELVLDNWNATAWLWADAPDRWPLGGFKAAYRVHRPRLLAQLALWTGVVWAGAWVGRRAAAWPGPALTGVRWAALVAAGFAGANVGLAFLFGPEDYNRHWQTLTGGHVGSALEAVWEDQFCWGYGFLLPYAAAAWLAAAAVGYLRGPGPIPVRQAPVEGGDLGWAGGVAPWPAEHWLGGPLDRTSGRRSGP